jgi:CRP/FNR family transcriptional regulator, anaerobic regulatory protein
MPETLKSHISKFIEISEEEFAAISGFFQIINPHKKETLLMVGEVCRFNYFVVSGCLRLFFIDNKGTEKTVQFAIENWWLADYFSFQARKSAEFGIQAVEKSQVLAIDYFAQEKMLAQFPKMERYFRLVHQRAHAASQLRTKYFYDFSREDLYRHFSNSFPEFIQRIPQYLLASYLDITPEYLSELRAKNIS